VTLPGSPRKQVVETYIDGFRTGDHERILGCLTDDVAWEMPPFFSLSGKRAFDEAIDNPATPGLPYIGLTRLVEEGDVVVAEGTVRVALAAGGEIDALFCDVFHFREHKICRLMTYQVDRAGAEQTLKALACSCGHALRRKPRTREEALALGRHQNAIRSLLEEVAVARGKWMSVLRCRLCGRFWAEDSLTSGHMDLFYAYPIATDDPHGWLEDATPLRL